MNNLPKVVTQRRLEQDLNSQPKSVGLAVKVGDHRALSLHSSNEPCGLPWCLRHDDSTRNVDICIIIRPHRSTV